MSNKIFLLGVGCQKGGTTWIHSHLNESQEVEFGFTKEYHILDAYYIDYCYKFLENTRECVRDYLLSGKEATPRQRKAVKNFHSM